jgi:hypothetical protein
VTHFGVDPVACLVGSLFHLISTFHERPYARPTNEKSICHQNLSIPKAIFAKFLIVKIATVTLYIDGMVFFNNLRYNGEGESGFHLMSENMFCRLDPLLNALLYNSYGIVNLLMEGRVCMCKVDSSKACIGNECS